MSYTMYTPLNVWLDPASVTDVVAYIQTYLSENDIYSEEEIEGLIHDYLEAHPELIGGVQSVNGKTGTVVLTASDINTANNVTIESVLASLSSQISSIASSVATNTSNITSLTGRVTTAETDISNLNQSNVATNSDIGKAHSPKTVVDGKVTEWQYIEAQVDPSDVAEAVDNWCDENITNPDSPPLDRSLSASSAAAPADLVGELKSNLDSFEGYINPDYSKIEKWNTDFFYGNDVFSVRNGSVTIDSHNPLIVTSASSGSIISKPIQIDSTETRICVDFEESSKGSLGGTLGFYNSSNTYISQVDFTFTNGKAFVSSLIPENAAQIRIFLNFYAANTYTFNKMYMYYGASQIQTKSFSDVLKDEIGLLGLNWSAVGDSLTAVTTLGAGVKNYADFVSDSLGLRLTNLGVAGTGYMNDGGTSKAFWQRYANIPSNTDVLTIMGSLNDLDLAYDNLGTLNDNNTTTLYGCMNTFLNGIYSINNGMRVGIILPMPWRWMNRRFPNEATTLKTEQYINAIIEFAKFNSIPILNLFDESGLHPWDDNFRTAYYKNADGTHLNSDGHFRFIYPKVKSFILKLISK